MPPPDLRDRLTSYLPFVVVAVAGQLSVGWPPGPTDSGAFLVSTLLLVVILVLIVIRRGMPPRTFIVGAALYMSSVALLMVASGGMGTGLGVLLFMPLVGVALYGKRWESAVCVVFLVSAILATQIVSSPGSIDTTTLLRRRILVGASAPCCPSPSISLRARLVESNAHTERLLRTRRRSTRPSVNWCSSRSRRRSRPSAHSSPWASWRRAGRRSSGRRTS